jgi:broad specificity phosphatase PhoE
VADRQQLTPQVEPAFRELCLGSLEGRRRDGSDPETDAQWAQWRGSAGRQPVPGGETFEAMMQRVAAALPLWIALAEQAPLLIVAHRNVNRAILATLLGWSPAAAFQQRISHRKLLTIRLGQQRMLTSERFYTP